jgi:antitoxin (DNA-binding transcriptional repressor) of toxin-antitoxin stability system
MTIAGAIATIGMDELRRNIRSTLARVTDLGETLVVMQHVAPAAVMIRFREAERWARIERSIAALHGLGVYPDLARDTLELPAILLGERKPSQSAIRAAVTQPREILAPLHVAGIADVRARLKSVLDEIAAGRPLTIAHGGEMAVMFISPREFDRLRGLERLVAWFRTAGLDLATADDEAVAAFVRDYRTPPAAAEPGAAAG